MRDEYLKIVQSLRKHHSLFAQFWTVGTVVEVDSPKMPTAAVSFSRKTGDALRFLINPSFWATLNDHSKAFVISHEIMHVYYDHGRRSLELDPKLANIAQDVVINHCLVDNFGFSRADITGGERYCWLDTVFKDKTDVEPGRCFEYYYQKLVEQGGPKNDTGEAGPSMPGEGEAGNQTVDVHDFVDEDDEFDEDALDAIQEAAEDLMDRITPEEIQDFQEAASNGSEEGEKVKPKTGKKAGTMAGTIMERIRLGKIVKKRKWETVVADVLGRHAGMERDLDLELWTKPNRRISTMAGDLMLPAEVTETVPVRDRIDVWFFQDTSGSCRHLAERFFKAAASVPEDRFRVRIFCFDTKVYETDLKSGKLYGFGGTAFQPLEDEIQNIIQKEPRTKYPQAVFVVTDGYGSNIQPEFPDRWHWFLSENYTRCIPSSSKRYNLKDYE